MSVLIVGSCGFVGSALVRFLSHYTRVTIYEADIVQQYGNNHYTQLHPNASDFEFEHLFKKTQYTTCINCSGAALVSASFDNPLHDYRLNTVNVYRMLNSLRIHQPTCQFITLSSAAVYGNPNELPVSESHDLNPLSPYGFHKVQAEQICKYFAEQFSLNITALRIFSAYGPGLKKQLFWDLYQKSLSYSEVKLFGTGQESRDFIYIDDLCQLILQLIQNPLIGYNVLNAASGTETKISDAVACFFSVLEFKGTFEFTNQDHMGYPKRWVANIQESKKLNFNAQTPLISGLEKYVKWIKESN